MLEIILIILILLAAVILIGSIRLRLRFEGNILTAEITFLILKTRLDLSSMILQFYLSGIRVYRTVLGGKKKKKSLKKIDSLKFIKGKKKKRKRWLKIPKDWRLYLSKAIWLLKKIRISYLVIKIRGGFADPYYTGNCFAAYTVAGGIAPLVMKHIDFRPDFSAEKLRFAGKGLIYIRIYYIVYVAVYILQRYLSRKFNEWFTIRKKGVSYG